MTSEDILQALPTKQQVLGTMIVTDILSNISTVAEQSIQNNLGYFNDNQWQFVAEDATDGSNDPPFVAE